MEGPVVNGLSAPRDWAERADWLARHLDIPRDGYLRRMKECLAALDTLAAHDEVVLWFEEDFFCQIHLVFVLARLAREARPAKLTLVCPEQPLGSHAPDELADVFAARTPASLARISLSGQVWAAYAGPDVAALNTALHLDYGYGAWPLLRHGLLAHHRRFPSQATGLGSIEATALSALAAGPAPFPIVFQAIAVHSLTAPLGIGDSQCWSRLRALAGAPRPLLTIHPSDGAWDTAVLEISEAGRRVLSGEIAAEPDHLGDWWLAGIRLKAGRSGPRWIEAAQRLVR